MNPKKHNTKQKEFFNQKAQTWDKIATHNPEKLQYITELLKIQSNDKILDIGTGTGIMIPYYEKHLKNGSVLAIDYSERMIEIARLKYPEKIHPEISYKISDIYDLKYNAEFDLIVCYSCFPHFNDKPLAIKILSKALKKEGCLAVAHTESAKKINGVHTNGGTEIQNDVLLTMKQLKQMMKKNGLTVTFQRDDENYFICLAKKTQSDKISPY
jgi:ubiquinone/menaquinone biosynthesis C-methylase UbiE